MKNWYKITFNPEQTANGKPEELENEYDRCQEVDSTFIAFTAAIFKIREDLKEGNIIYFLTPDCAFYFPHLVNKYDYEMSEVPSVSDLVPVRQFLKFDVTQLLSPHWQWIQ